MLAARSSRLSDATLQSLKSPFTLHTHVCHATRQRGTGEYIIYAFRFFKPDATQWYASLFHETCEKVCMPACCCLNINKTLKRCSCAYRYVSLWLQIWNTITVSNSCVKYQHKWCIKQFILTLNKILSFLAKTVKIKAAPKSVRLIFNRRWLA